MGIFKKIFSRGNAVDALPGSDKLVKKAADKAAEQSYDITVTLLPNPSKKSKGNEAWLLSALNGDGTENLNLADLDIPATLELKKLSGADNPALLFSGNGTLNLSLKADSVLEFLGHAWSGILSLSYGGQAVTIDLYSPIGTKKRILVQDIVTRTTGTDWMFTEGELRWIEDVRSKDAKVLAVVNPEWRGVKSATENLVDTCLLLQDDLTELSAERFSALILKTGVKRIFIGGFPITFGLLAKAIKRQDSSIHVFAFWLSSFMQSNEDYAWHSFLAMNQLCREGVIEKIGFAKKGMAETVSRTGVNAEFIPSCVRKIPEKASKPLSGGPHIGIWALAPIWRKNPFAMLAATAEIDNAKVFVVGQDERAAEFSKYLGLEATIQQEPIPQEEMAEYLGRMDINLYVTLSECSPMLPLESLAAGVPCLFGPNSHLFEDNPYLHSRLVVPYPDRSDVIAEKIKQALKERDRIVCVYADYAKKYNQYCKTSLQAFHAQEKNGESLKNERLQ